MKANINKTFLLFTITLIISTFGCTTTKTTPKNHETTFYEFIQKQKDSLFKFNDDERSKIAQDHFLKGLNYYDNKDFVHSVLEFETALKFDTSSTIYLSLADAYVELQDLYNALDAAMNAFLLDTTNTKAMEMMFSLFAFKGDTLAAEKVLSEIYTRNPNEENFKIFTDFLSNTNPQKAIEIFEKSNRENYNEETKINLATLYFQLSDTAKSLEILYEVVQNNPTDANNYDFIRIASKFSRFDYLKKFMTEIYPKLENERKENVFLYYSEELAKFKKELTENKEFIRKVLNDFKELKTNNVFAFFNSAQLGYKIQDTNLTIYYSRKALDEVDTLFVVPLLISNYLFNVGARDEAFQVLNRFREKFPEQLDYPFQIALLNFLDKKYEIARKYAEEVLHFNPEYIDAITMIADSYDKEGRYKDAEQYYRKALQINPDSPVVNNNFAYFLSKFDDKLNDAEEMSLKAINAEPNNASFIDTYGWILYRKGNLEEARKFLEKALELMDNDNYELYEHLALLYFKMGKGKEAIENMKKALDSDPSNEKLKEEYQEIENSLNLKNK